MTFYQAVGGEETFRRLIAHFYQGVAADPLLRRLYPDEDLASAEERLRLFLVQYWGGPPTYSERRGHPALRMRHARFAIGPAERDAWLGHMNAAIDALGLPEQLAAQLRDYVTIAARALTNRPG
jgi:hemoglobin